MKTGKFKIASFGSISHATMRNQDLIPRFASELRYLGHRSTELTAIESRFSRAMNGKHGESDSYFESEESAFDLEWLFDALNEHSPAYGYFGSHAGDGSDYGFWMDEDIQSNFDGLIVDDTSKIPAKYRGEILHLNDHGNVTLYFKNRLGLREIWAVV